MSKKVEFVERASVPGAKLAPLCREFGISRQTGHKWLKRFREQGFEGLEEQSRRPRSSPLALAEQLVVAVIETRDAHPSWGPKKIHQLLRRRFGEQTPSAATVARMLKRFGRIRERRRRRPLSIIERPPAVVASKPNEVWTVDFKGWWTTTDGSRCEPLTVRDAYSRFVLAVRLVPTTAEGVRTVLEDLFRKHGLPTAIQCDNGTPFVCVRARAGLSRLSAWWVSLGIRIVRGRPGCPQDNGGHERMHRDVAEDVEQAPAKTLDMQQRILERWRLEFNNVRPHDAIGGKSPVEVYAPSERRSREALPPVYPPHFVTKRVARNGMIRIDNVPYHLSSALTGYVIGLEQLDDFRWRVWFYDIDCGELEVVPRWLDSFVPHAATSSQKRPGRHDARHRQSRTAAHAAARANPEEASLKPQPVNFSSTGS